MKSSNLVVLKIYINLKNRIMKLPYKCTFNTLPEWMKTVIVAEAIVFNIVIVSAIIVLIYLKYKLKQLKN